LLPDFEDGNNNINVEEINGDVTGSTGSSDAFEGSHDEPNEVFPIIIKDMVDIMKIDLENFCLADVERYEFVGIDVAYLFYSLFARTSGFSVRKGQVVRDWNGEVVQQTFVCSCQGFREDRGLTMETRKREPKNETRCGCNAKFRVHLDILSRHWYVTVFEFDHNHDLLGGTLCRTLPTYKKMSEADIAEIDRNRKTGIRPYQMYGSLANASGGFHKVGFVKKDLYNQVARQRKSMFSDACGAVKYLRDLCTNDPLIFVKSCIDDNRRLERLFWCDGESRVNYEIFGDVLAFDATYRKNK